MGHKQRHAQTGAWLIPLLYAAGALLLGTVVPRLADDLLPGLVSSISTNAAIGIYSAVASGMIALTGIVFSLTFVMVQFSATAYSPRLVLWIARDPMMSHAMGVFTATFLYALIALAWVDRHGSGRTPLVSVLLVTALLIVSIVLFISLINRVGMLQVNRMLVFTGNQGRQVIESLYPPIASPVSSPGVTSCPAPCRQTLFHHGDPRVIQGVDVPRLIRMASRARCVIELAASVGDAVLDSIPMVRVRGGNGPLPEKDLRLAIELGSQRTFEQDPKYGIRLLVDIAIKALSPAVNDPTTAVQALDQIEDLLLRLGRRRLEIGAFADAAGELRVLIVFPSWEDFLRLAFDEIRFYGASSVQVMRRMQALISELIEVLPVERRSALDAWRVRLQSTIEHSFPAEEDRLSASAEDRQGLGTSRQKEFVRS
jgi:uncharacterized membrane protein